ncbi:sigma-70 family RNA polymerase sigma factor [Roseinatronobacter monicus]|uniref:RNA polymerase sigma-70 factor (ECF subfamily) n=1 Tax=Roseinatronobacter monicus TaxID=393481 RepID=A0A543K3G0_9RHOB|nr:sigma-70 family RNA polymerase sigma factor [Roseinatronobacter monicus]TQM89574.1 RNA polymerase sigma-70 factor (ECF subfamily) [Roseinatronobacter monicus]
MKREPKRGLNSLADTDALEDLMRAANRGDSAAYHRLFTAITPVLRKVVRARGAALGHAGCEDVLQDVLLAIHSKRHTWREDAPLRPWLYAIARHKVVDAFRARGRHVAVSIDDFAEGLPATAGPDPMEGRDMDKVLGQLEPRAAEIVRAFGLNGETTAETAARLDMSEGAVRVALHRALKSIARLRERMIE